MAVAGVHAARPVELAGDARRRRLRPARRRLRPRRLPPRRRRRASTDARATRIFLAYPKVASWLHRYPTGASTTATYFDGVWQVNVFYGPAGEIASGKVADSTGQVTEAFTGPQVAWGMARGGNGFGGKKINSWRVWLFFSIVFLLGLVDWRRPLVAPNGRPARADLVPAVAVVLQPRPHLRVDVADLSRLRRG